MKYESDWTHQDDETTTEDIFVPDPLKPVQTIKVTGPGKERMWLEVIWHSDNLYMIESYEGREHMNRAWSDRDGVPGKITEQLGEMMEGFWS